jgi:outer membrane murein-binding lipoprotein Lpp
MRGGNVGRALINFKLNLGMSGIGRTTYLALVFAVLLAANVMAFEYYQARVTRDYIQILYTNLARMNGEMGALEEKFNQLSTKISALEAKIDQLTTKTDASAAKPDKPGPPTSHAPPPRKCRGLFC